MGHSFSQWKKSMNSLRFIRIGLTVTTREHFFLFIYLFVQYLSLECSCSCIINIVYIVASSNRLTLMIIIVVFLNLQCLQKPNFVPNSHGDRFIPRRYALQPDLMTTSFNLSEPESDHVDIFEMVNSAIRTHEAPPIY